MWPMIISAAIGAIGSLGKADMASKMPMPSQPVVISGGNASTVYGNGNSVNQTGPTPYVNAGVDPNAAAAGGIAGLPVEMLLLIGVAAYFLMES